MTTFAKDQLVSINGEPWVVVEHKEGNTCVWATRLGGPGTMWVGHKVDDVKLPAGNQHETARTEDAPQAQTTLGSLFSWV